MWKRDYGADVSAVPPGRGDFCGRYQTLRVWLISGCAFGTNAVSSNHNRCGAAADIQHELCREATLDISQLRSGWWRIDEKHVLKGRRN